MEKINVVVVEAHNHALEHIHYIIRKHARHRNRQQQRQQQQQEQEQEHKWTMVHFDSHPDLACPSKNIPALACFLPRKEWDVEANANNNDDAVKSDIRGDSDSDGVWGGDGGETKNLYEFLDTSQSGIAEWILPLVLAAGLRTIYWVKNSWCHQFQIGTYDFGVGAYVNRKQNGSQEDYIGNGDGYGSGNGSGSGNKNGNDNVDEKEQNTANENRTITRRSKSGQERQRQRQKLQSFLDLPNDAVVKSSLMHPYYIDDNSHAHVDELDLVQRLQLIVTEVENDGNGGDCQMNSLCECTCEDMDICRVNYQMYTSSSGAMLNSVKNVPPSHENQDKCDRRDRDGQEMKIGDCGNLPHNKSKAARTYESKSSRTHITDDLNSTHDRDEEDWILDVCLDYFYCSNPFIDELEVLDGEMCVDESEDLSKRESGSKIGTINGQMSIAHLLVRIVSETKIRHMALNISAAEPASKPTSQSEPGLSMREAQKEQYRAYLREFTHLVKKLLKRVVCVIRLGQSVQGEMSRLADEKSSFLTSQEYQQLYQLYISPAEAKSLWNEFVHAIIHWHFRALKKRENDTAGGQHCSGNDEHPPIEKLVKVILNALPNINLPHVGDELSMINGIDGSLNPSILSKVKEFGEYLRQKEMGEQCVDGISETIFDGKRHRDYVYDCAPKPPMCIMIARSSNDGFTPNSIVESLQEAVLREIHSVYCQCPRSQFSGGAIQLKNSPYCTSTAITTPNNHEDFQHCRLDFIFDYGENEGSSLEAMYE